MSKKDDLSTPSLSPITTQCDPVIASKLIESLPHLRSLDFEEQLLPEIWKELLKYQFTHLHETDHNIFSPNKVNLQPVNGLFLSSHTLHQLLNDDTQDKITDELIQFIVDLLNFQQECSPSDNEPSDKLPDKIIFQPQGNENKLNALMLLMITNNDPVQSSDELSLLIVCEEV